MDDLTAAGIVLVPISVDEPATSRALQKRLGLEYPIYTDTDGAASRAWDVWDPETEISLSATFVVAPGGRVIFRYLAADKADRPTVDDILAAVGAAANGR